MSLLGNIGKAAAVVNPIALAPVVGADIGGLFRGRSSGGNSGAGPQAYAQQDYNPDSVNQIFLQGLGREASQAEHDYLKPYVQQGVISPYQIGQYLQSTPEAQKTQLAQYGQQYSDVLGKNDQTILNRSADTAQQQFAQQGRQFSTGQGNSVLQAGQNLAMDRNSYLSNFYGQGYQGLMNTAQQQGQGALQRAYGLQDQNRQRDWQLTDYTRQQNDFNNYLNGQNTRNMQQGLFNAAVGLPGAALGAYGRSQKFGG